MRRFTYPPATYRSCTSFKEASFDDWLLSTLPAVCCEVVDAFVRVAPSVLPSDTRLENFLFVAAYSQV
jgi:hypothetical protein